jgi:hypothetical protein
MGQNGICPKDSSRRHQCNKCLSGKHGGDSCTSTPVRPNAKRAKSTKGGKGGKSGKG